MLMFRQDFLARSLRDEELLSRTRRCVSNERKIQAQFLAYLAEIDRRRLFAIEYHSLFAFVVGEFGYSESTALKRIHVARAAVQFPCMFYALEEGKVSLTALSKLAPHLT